MARMTVAARRTSPAPREKGTVTGTRIASARPSAGATTAKEARSQGTMTVATFPMTVSVTVIIEKV